MGEIKVFPKPKRSGDPKVLEIVKNQRCCACGKYPSDPHHVTSRGAGGKDTGDNVMPLCQFHHVEWHQIGPSRMIDQYGGVKSWLDRHERVDVLLKCGKTGEERGTQDAIDRNFPRRKSSGGRSE